MPHYIFEARFLKTMPGPICGVDEAGRGPLAGPVVAAAVILDRRKIPGRSRRSQETWRGNARGALPPRPRNGDCRGRRRSERRRDRPAQYPPGGRILPWRAGGALTVARPHFALVDGNDAPALPCSCDTPWAAMRARFPSRQRPSSPRSRATALCAHCTASTRSMAGTPIRATAPPEHLIALEKFGTTSHHRRSFAPRIQSEQWTQHLVCSRFCGLKHNTLRFNKELLYLSGLRQNHSACLLWIKRLLAEGYHQVLGKWAGLNSTW